MMIKLGRLSPPRSKLCRFKIRSGPSGFGLFFYPLNPVSSSFHFRSSFSFFSSRSFCFPVSSSFHFRSCFSSFSSRSFCFPVSLSFHFRSTLPPSPNRLCSFVVSLSFYFLFVELLSSFFFSWFSIKSIRGLGGVWRLVLLRVFRSLLNGFYEYLVVCLSPIAFLAKDIPERCGVDFKLYCRTPLVVIA